MPVPNILGIVLPTKADGWSVMTLGPGPLPARYDLCEDCAEVLVEQFLVGARIEAITKPAGQNVLPHDNVPYQDCLLAFDPEAGGFVCEHDDPERFQKLCTDRAQNVAEGVPERKICSNCGCVSHKEFGPCSSTGCECMVDKVGRRVNQMVSDVITAGVAHAVPQHFTADDLTRAGADSCGEEHTYRGDCALKHVNTPGQIMPPACGPECDPKLGNHTNVLGSCLNNPSTLAAVLMVCPICKQEGSGVGITAHMAEHGYAPDYINAQWVDGRGYNLDGRLISQQGEDLTEAYSEQEPAGE